MRKLLLIVSAVILFSTNLFAGNPADLSANAKTKKLYAWLEKNYGVNIISGMMSRVSWNIKGSQNVYNRTGKWPAINGFDFINIVAQDQDENNYNDISPVVDWAQNGGICAFVWHFCAENKSNTFYSYQTSVTPSQVLDESTSQHTFFVQELDSVANIFLKLQKAGVVGLWRPFHEGSGNNSGAWFWWGRDGAEKYKQLWYYMWNYFQKKGVHNLIWIWNSQIHEHDDSSWYPGDDYVDIIADDLYTKDANACNDVFYNLKTKYTNKIVTLAECGNVDNVSAQWNKGAKWLYFMPWYAYDYLSNVANTGDDQYSTNSWWADAMSMSNVITRDKVDYGDDPDSYAVDIDTSNVDVLSSESVVMNDAWSNSILVGLGNASVGDTLRCHISNLSDGAQAELDNSNWATVLGPFGVSGDHFDVILTSEEIAAFTAGGGLRIKGTKYTLDKVELIHPIAKIILSVPESGFSTYSGTTNLYVPATASVKAYKAVVDATTSLVTFKNVESIAAGEGVLLHGAPNASYTAKSITKATAPANNAMVAGSGTTITDADSYVLQTINGTTAFYSAASGIMVPSEKAYLKLPSSFRAKNINISLEGVVTSIKSLTNGNIPVKSSVMYNLAGQRVNGSYKGVVIKNGMKYINK